MSDVWIEYFGSSQTPNCYECGHPSPDEMFLINIRFRDNGCKIILCHDCFAELQETVELKIMAFEKSEDEWKTQHGVDGDEEDEEDEIGKTEKITNP